MAKRVCPCDICTRTTSCAELECDRWRMWYLYRQRLINGYAKKLAATPKTYWIYYHPDEIRLPNITERT